MPPQPSWGPTEDTLMIIFPIAEMEWEGITACFVKFLGRHWDYQDAKLDINERYRKLVLPPSEEIGMWLAGIRPDSDIIRWAAKWGDIHDDVTSRASPDISIPTHMWLTNH